MCACHARYWLCVVMSICVFIVSRYILFVYLASTLVIIFVWIHKKSWQSIPDLLTKVIMQYNTTPDNTYQAYIPRTPLIALLYSHKQCFKDCSFHIFSLIIRFQTAIFFFDIVLGLRSYLLTWERTRAAMVLLVTEPQSQQWRKCFSSKIQTNKKIIFRKYRLRYFNYITS